MGNEYDAPYLWISIAISTVVIVSKFVLLSYNQKRRLIAFNLLSYLIDIGFTLFLSLFIGALLFQRIFNFVGLYMTMELLFCVPFVAKFIIERGNSMAISTFNIPFFLMFWYPLAIAVFPCFSMYPFWIRALTNPERIGKKQKFHQDLFEYCRDSKDDTEFNLKLVVINYVCIRTYFDRLRESDDAEFYAFAKKLHQWDPQRLNEYALSRCSFQDDRFLSGDASMTLFKLKSYQISMRIVFVFCAALLDVFYLELFTSNEQFINGYIRTTSTLSILGLLFAMTWLALFIRDVRGQHSKWHTFCCYMNMSKHSAFIMSMSTDKFIQRCEATYSGIVDIDNTLANPHIAWSSTMRHAALKNIRLDWFFPEKSETTKLTKFVAFVLIGLQIAVVARVAFSSQQDRQSRTLLALSILSLLFLFCIAIKGRMMSWNATFAVSAAQLIVVLFLSFVYYADAEDAALSTDNADIIYLLGLQFVITGTPFTVFFHKVWAKLKEEDMLGALFFGGVAVMLLLCGIGKDVALLLVNDEYSCSDSVSAGDSTTLGVALWIDVGCISSIAELGLMCCGVTLTLVFGQTSDSSAMPMGLIMGFFAVFLLGVAMGLFQLVWIGFGFEIFSVLENETSSDEACYAAVLAWNIVALLLGLMKVCFGGFYVGALCCDVTCRCCRRHC